MSSVGQGGGRGAGEGQGILRYRDKGGGADGGARCAGGGGGKVIVRGVMCQARPGVRGGRQVRSGDGSAQQGGL